MKVVKKFLKRVDSISKWLQNRAFRGFVHVENARQGQVTLRIGNLYTWRVHNCSRNGPPSLCQKQKQHQLPRSKQTHIGIESDKQVMDSNNDEDGKWTWKKSFASTQLPTWTWTGLVISAKSPRYFIEANAARSEYVGSSKKKKNTTRNIPARNLRSHSSENGLLQNPVHSPPTRCLENGLLQNPMPGKWSSSKPHSVEKLVAVW